MKVANEARANPENGRTFLLQGLPPQSLPPQGLPPKTDYNGFHGNIEKIWVCVPRYLRYPPFCDQRPADEPILLLNDDRYARLRYRYLFIANMLRFGRCSPARILSCIVTSIEKSCPRKWAEVDGVHIIVDGARAPNSKWIGVDHTEPIAAITVTFVSPSLGESGCRRSNRRSFVCTALYSVLSLEPSVSPFTPIFPQETMTSCFRKANGTSITDTSSVDGACSLIITSELISPCCPIKSDVLGLGNLCLSDYLCYETAPPSGGK